jgi:hypothetical protein
LGHPVGVRARADSHWAQGGGGGVAPARRRPWPRRRPGRAGTRYTRRPAPSTRNSRTQPSTHATLHTKACTTPCRPGTRPGTAGCGPTLGPEASVCVYSSAPRRALLTHLPASVPRRARSPLASVPRLRASTHPALLLCGPLLAQPLKETGADRLCETGETGEDRLCETGETGETGEARLLARLAPALRAAVPIRLGGSARAGCGGSA